MNEQRPAQSGSARLPGLEALRCVAAVCVLLLHTRAVYGGTPVFARGYLGVDFFLMLSGFLMARVQEPRLDAGMNPFSFLWKRYKRLWPMMAAGALLGLPMQWLRSKGLADFLEVVVLNLALVPVLNQPFVFPVNIPAWTIFYELFANAAHVLGLRHLRRLWLPLAIVLLAPAELLIAFKWHGLDVGAKPQTFALGAVRVVFAYLIGMALSRWWRHAAPPPVPAVPAILSMPALLALGWWLGVDGKHDGAWFDLGFVVLVAPLMIAGALRLRRFAAIAAAVGPLSFPLFALQMPVLEGLRHFGVSGWIGGSAALGVGIAGLFLASALGKWRQAPREKAA